MAGNTPVAQEWAFYCLLCANCDIAAIIMVTDGCLGCHEKLLPKFSVLLDEAETTVAQICNAQLTISVHKY